MRVHWARCAFGVLLGASAIGCLASEPAPTGWLTEQRFERYSPLAAKDELLDRVLVPTLVDRIRRFEAREARNAAEHTIDLSKERFDLYVPERPASSGYGVLVFVSPMPDFPLSWGWKSELRKRGIIFVAARKSGNQQNVLDRRIPLALHALENVRHRYAVDSERVYISGFSGGSRVAWRMARAYADVFHGALLMAGSDAFGEFDTAPPLPHLMQSLRDRSRIVLATGTGDMPNRAKDRRTRDSLDEFCVPGATTVSIPRLDHWVPPQHKFAEALDALDRPIEPRPDRAECERGIELRIQAGIAEVEAMLQAGDAAAAGIRLGELEDLFGGLLPFRAVELARSISDQIAVADAE